MNTEPVPAATQASLYQSPLAISSVAIDVEKNLMHFRAPSELKGGGEYECGDWGLYGQLFYTELDQADHEFWRPYNEIPTVIAYTNYQLRSTRICPKRKEHIEHLARVFQEQNAIVTLRDDLRQSIDQQIATLPEPELQEMVRQQDTDDFYAETYPGLLFYVHSEYREFHGGPKFEGPAF